MLKKKYPVVFIFILLCLGLSSSGVFGQVARYDSLMDYAKEYVFKTPDKTIVSLKEALEIAKGLDDFEKITNSTLELGVAYSYSKTNQNENILSLLGDFLNQYEGSTPTDKLSEFYNLLGAVISKMGDDELALQHYFTALNYAKESDKLGLVGQLHHNIGYFYEEASDYDRAYTNYMISHKIGLSQKDTISTVFTTNSFGNLYLLKKKLDSAEVFFHQELILAKKVEFALGVVNSLIGLGDVALGREQFELAEGYYKKALSEKVIAEEQKGIIYNQLGTLEEGKGEYQKAISYYNQTISLANEQSDLELQAIALKKLSEIYDLIKSPEESLRYLKQYQQIDDSLQIRNLSSLIKVKDYQYKEKYRKEIQQKSKNILYLIIALTSLCVVFLSYVIFNQIRKHRLIIKNKENTIRHQKEEGAILKEDIELKSTKLTQRMLQINASTNYKKKLLDKLKEMKNLPSNEIKNNLNSLINNIKITESSLLWEEFEVYFTEVHPIFYKKLSQDFPKLTVNERRLCGFIKLNLHTKDISRITKQSPNSIKVARIRLRKKIGLTGDSQSITEFLSNY